MPAFQILKFHNPSDHCSPGKLNLSIYKSIGNAFLNKVISETEELEGGMDYFAKGAIAMCHKIFGASRTKVNFS